MIRLAKARDKIPHHTILLSSSREAQLLFTVQCPYGFFMKSNPYLVLAHVSSISPW